MGAELAPKRLRDVFVTVLFASFPGGGFIGSLTSAWVIPAFGWQAVFYIGAVAPIVIAIILAIWLPESIRFLLARNIRQDEVRRTLERIMPGEVPAGAELVAPPDPAREGVPVKHLFMEGRAIPTVLLWVPFFMVFMVLVTVTFWTPAVLHSVGFSLSAAALIIGLNNLGSVIASAMSGWLVHRGGAFRVLIPGFIIGGLCLAWFGQATSSMVTLGAASFLAGFFVGGTGTGLIAVAAGMYPTADPFHRHRLGDGHGPSRPGLRADLDRRSGRTRAIRSAASSTPPRCRVLSARCSWSSFILPAPSWRPILPPAWRPPNRRAEGSTCLRHCSFARAAGQSERRATSGLKSSRNSAT